MSCARLSLFTNVTRDPTGTLIDRGDAPLDVIVIVMPPGAGPGEGFGFGAGVGEDGVLLLPPPQPRAATTNIAAGSMSARRKGAALVQDWCTIRRTSLKY